VIRTLQDCGIIDIVGRAEGLGRPLLYGTTTRFLEHFGFRSLSDLPTPEELPVVLRERTPLGIEEGAPAEMDQEAGGQVVMPLRGGADSAAGEASAAGDAFAKPGTNGAAGGAVGLAATALDDDEPTDPFLEEPEDA
jgi:segregation and condensation protein B